jgi:hypothetical protein
MIDRIENTSVGMVGVVIEAIDDGGAIKKSGSGLGSGLSRGPSRNGFRLALKYL